MPPTYKPPADAAEAVTITIGRNIGAAPMVRSDWDEFKGAVRDWLQRRGAALWVDSEGVGPWADGLETNHVFVGQLDHTLVDEAREMLAERNYSGG